MSLVAVDIDFGSCPFSVHLVSRGGHSRVWFSSPAVVTVQYGPLSGGGHSMLSP